ARYAEAHAGLKKLQASYPNFNSTAVSYRLDYVTEKLNVLPKGSNIATNAPAARPMPTRPADQVKYLSDQVAQLQNENSVLQAKLKEALSAQPAAVDPRNLAEAEDRANSLAKERELLNVEVEQLKAKQPGAPDLVMLDQTRGELASANKRLTDTVANLAALAQERQALQTRVATLETELEQARNGAPQAAPVQDNTALTQRIAALQQQVETLTAENARLTAAANEEAPAPEGGKSGEMRDRLKKAEKDRDEALKKLNDANKELYDIKARGQLAQVQQLTNQLGNLRARLEVFEARKVPFTEEELALMTKSTSIKTTAETRPAAKKPIAELPSGAGNLVAEAQRAFAARRFDEAEAKYKQVLAIDERNPVTLAGLAAIQVEMGKNQEAEDNLNKALAEYPDNAYSLSLLGLAKFNQEKYAEALDVLAKSAQLDPKNPETQNYLGITLSQQGQREAAETALRKAIQLNPGYAGAHQNLAVIYATQKPPMLELARFHYNKATTAGHPKNETLEQLLNRDGGATATPSPAQ
ncbi:MAG: tetratricopeptide repeat protein, partial [Verrucomicrobiales bacterium]